MQFFIIEERNKLYSKKSKIAYQLPHGHDSRRISHTVAEAHLHSSCHLEAWVPPFQSPYRCNRHGSDERNLLCTASRPLVLEI
jgi:hypothetical protein